MLKQSAIGGAIDDSVATEHHRRGVRVITTSANVAEVTAIFEDEGYTVIGPLPLDDPRRPPHKR